MRNLLKYLKDYKKETILAPLFKMLEASFELLIPLVVKRIVDIGIAGGDRGYVWNMCLVMIGLAVIGLICSLTAQYFSARAAVGFGTGLRHALFQRIQGFTYSQMDQRGPSTLLTRMTSDINQIQNGVNLVLRLFLRSPFIVLGAMVMAFTIDVKAALIFLVVIPVLSIVVFGIMLITIPLYKKVQSALDQVLGITRGNLTGVRVLRAFHKEEEEIVEFEEKNQTLMKLQMFVGRVSAFMNPVTYGVLNTGLIVLLWVGALRVNSGILTQGAVLALVNYISQILVELIKLANLIITINKALACGKRVEAVLLVEPDLEVQTFNNKTELSKRTDFTNQRELTGTEPPIVEFQKVCLTYPGAGAESLTDISFQAKRGQTIGVIGGTGSGKTSLVNLIPRFYEATGGCVLVEGRPVNTYAVKELREKIGMVPQKAVLFQGTIRDNLLFGKEDATQEEIDQALEISQSAEFVLQKPKGLETALTQGGKNLSGGQRQRLTIARALVRKPDILILDDSASALDYATDLKLRKALRAMEKPPVVFLVAQRASSVLMADEILVLEDGRVVGQGTHEELIDTCEVYQEIYYSQYPKKEEMP